MDKETRTCSCCRSSLPLTSFGVDKHHKSGINKYCLDCTRAKNAHRWKNNRDAVLASVRAYKLRNREKILAYKRAYRVRKSAEKAAAKIMKADLNP